MTELDQVAAYIKGSPITLAEQMPIKPTWAPMDEEWQQAISDKYWATNYTGELDDKMRCMITLRDRLLSFGGNQACLPYLEEDLRKIMNRGQFWGGDRIMMMKGAPSQCHRNSSALWDANRDKVVLCTGYALSLDGMWRQHSWCILLRPRKNRVVETTVKRVAYFGFVMTDKEADEFYLDSM